MIRSVYAKVLLGFAAIAALGVVAVAVTAWLLLAERTGPEQYMERTFLLHAGLASDALRAGGPAGLARFLARLDAAYHGRHFLVDEAGRDAVDGGDRSAYLSQASDTPTLVAENVVLTRPAGDGRHRLVLVIGQPGLAAALPYLLWVPAGMALACLLLAYRLIRPVRRLQSAVERFGRGDFAARSGVTDKDEIGRLAAAFDRMAEQIERLVVAERRLLQDVSHELRSPLARLGFAVELAETAADRPAAFARVRKEVRRLTDLVAELIELALVEADPAAGGGRPIDLAEVVSEVADDCLIEAEARGCRIEGTIGERVEVTGRAGLLRRVVENVVRNAVRYAPAGTAVEVRLEARGGWAVVTVRDRGPGVPAGALDAIFDPFFRVEEDRGRDAGGGVGLGLAIARRAVTSHGGRIAARNASPGLEVRVELPGLPFSPTSTAASRTAPPATGR
jgi:two-component system sensor histidine kinase CpxA